MLALGQLLNKPKNDDKELQHFRSKVNADQTRLKTLLEQRSHEV